jgi:hypothetical protein
VDGDDEASGGFLRDNSLSLALFALFLVCVSLQSVTGWMAFNSAQSDVGAPQVGWASYLRTGDFLDGIFSNWQAAVLQLAVLIAFSSVLRQRGAAHSRKMAHGDVGKLDVRTIEWKFHRRESAGRWLYANSLSLAFVAAFALTLAAHSVTGWMKTNETRALSHLAPQAWGEYAASAAFLESLFQTWEAEFFAIALYVVLSIYLRQEHSPESKTMESDSDDTGETNH